MGDAATVLSHKNALLNWASSYPYALCLFSNAYADDYGEYVLLISVAKTSCALNHGRVFTDVDDLLARNGWLTGYFGYDLKNETEELRSENPDHTGFVEACFFIPEILIAVKRDGSLLLEGIRADDLSAILDEPFSPPKIMQPVAWKSRFSREDYVHTVAQIRQHIGRGDIYETNFCQEFYVDDHPLDPVSAFLAINARAPAPFSAFLRTGNQYALSFSPERFLRRRKQLLVSQPIKGTAPRGANAADDEDLRNRLLNDAKERAENIMITDLVRNDMARSAVENSVQVASLCEVRAYPAVHQMISTVTGTVKKDPANADIIRNMFPMGSMTGAPKLRAMQLMETFERSKRGLYSGAIGYFSPGGNFDFNVAIRTLLYNAGSGYLSYHTGSAITHASDPENEYEECLLKRRIVDFL